MKIEEIKDKYKAADKLLAGRTDATIIRALARLLNPDYIRQQGIESINDAKEKKGEPLEDRIPEFSPHHFNLELCSEVVDEEEESYRYVRLEFRYNKHTGYVYSGTFPVL